MIKRFQNVDRALRAVFVPDHGKLIALVDKLHAKRFLDLCQVAVKFAEKVDKQAIVRKLQSRLGSGVRRGSRLTQRANGQIKSLRQFAPLMADAAKAFGKVQAHLVKFTDWFTRCCGTIIHPMG